MVKPENVIRYRMIRANIEMNFLNAITKYADKGQDSVDFPDPHGKEHFKSMEKCPVEDYPLIPLPIDIYRIYLGRAVYRGKTFQTIVNLDEFNKLLDLYTKYECIIFEGDKNGL